MNSVYLVPAFLKDFACKGCGSCCKSNMEVLADKEFLDAFKVKQKSGKLEKMAKDAFVRFENSLVKCNIA